MLRYSLALTACRASLAVMAAHAGICKVCRACISCSRVIAWRRQPGQGGDAQLRDGRAGDARADDAPRRLWLRGQHGRRRGVPGRHPARLLRARGARGLRRAPARRGQYAVGHLFLPKEPELYNAAKGIIAKCVSPSRHRSPGCYTFQACACKRRSAAWQQNIITPPMLPPNCCRYPMCSKAAIAW